MHAYALSGPDSLGTFIEVPTPVPGPGEVRIRVASTSVNPVDHLVRSGFFRGVQEYRYPAVIGRDLAGVVDAVGPGVTTSAVGDRVFGFVKRPHIGDGTFASQVVVPADQFVGPAPSGLALGEAGVLGLSGVTALECVDAVAAGPGDVLLVNGATGGVGTFAVQIATAAGATVIATARTEEQGDLVRSLGATHVVDWSAGGLVEQVNELAPQGLDGVIDLVRHVDSAVMGVGEDDARAAFARLCHGLLRPGGRAASVTNGGVAQLLGDIAFTNVHSTPTPGSMRRLASLVDRAALRAPIHATFAFPDLEAAFDLLAHGPSLGKISVILDQELS